VSITNLVFGTEYTKSVEAKQIAQQDADRARNLVERARQRGNRIMVQAEGDAKKAELYGIAYKQNTSYMELRRIEAAREIAKMLGRS
jgi:prohibitin 2